jgi:hypothetical protein
MHPLSEKEQKKRQDFIFSGFSIWGSKTQISGHNYAVSGKPRICFPLCPRFLP